LAKNRAKNAHIPVYAALFRTIFCQVGTKIERFAWVKFGPIALA